MPKLPVVIFWKCNIFITKQLSDGNQAVKLLGERGGQLFRVTECVISSVVYKHWLHDHLSHSLVTHVIMKICCLVHNFVCLKRSHDLVCASVKFDFCQKWWRLECFTSYLQLFRTWKRRTEGRSCSTIYQHLPRVCQL